MGSKNGLSDQPQHVNDQTWYYEEPNGITVVHETYNLDGEHVQTDSFVIPWRNLRASLWRMSSRKK